MRLRVRPADAGAAATVRQELTEAARAFFAEHPSEAPVPEDEPRLPGGRFFLKSQNLFPKRLLDIDPRREQSLLVEVETVAAKVD